MDMQEQYTETSCTFQVRKHCSTHCLKTKREPNFRGKKTLGSKFEAVSAKSETLAGYKLKSVKQRHPNTRDKVKVIKNTRSKVKTLVT